jgi:hypothetical protein
MYDQIHIPNGDYAVEMDGVVHQFRVWLVQSGQLNGQRIVKHLGRDGTFRGFAFITRDGNLRIWNRFSSQSTSAHALAFERVMALLTDRSDDDGVSFQVRTRCAICNNYATDTDLTDDSVSVALCGNHSHIRDSNPGDGFLSEPRRSVSSVIADMGDDDEETVDPPTRPRRSRTPRVLMCENGTGHVR